MCLGTDNGALWPSRKVIQFARITRARLPTEQSLIPSREREPLEFTLGEGMLIPGFEAAVEGHEAGDTVTVTIPPDQAYGVRTGADLHCAARAGA